MNRSQNPPHSSQGNMDFLNLEQSAGSGNYLIDLNYLSPNYKLISETMFVKLKTNRAKHMSSLVFNVRSLNWTLFYVYLNVSNFDSTFLPLSDTVDLTDVLRIFFP